MMNSINNKSIYQRKLSASERLYLSTTSMGLPFYVQFVVEGNGTIDKDSFQKAVDKASIANPGSRVFLSGRLNKTKWIDSGIIPLVYEVNGNDWDGMSPNKMPAIESRLDPYSGIVCEIVIIHGKPLRIIFRTLHSVMDGGGLVHWAEDVFRALRNEPCIGSNSLLTDHEYALSFGVKEYRKNFAKTCSPPTGSLDASAGGFSWLRKQFTGKYPGIIARIAVLLADEIRDRNKTSDVRFMIPTDLRHLNKNILTTANFSNPLYINIPPDAKWKEIYNDLIRQMAQKKQLITGRFDNLLRFLPTALIDYALKHAVEGLEKKNRYSLTGIISHLGKINNSAFQCDHFKANSGFFVPIHVPGIPLFIGIMEIENGVELIISMSNKLGNKGRMESLLQTIESKLFSV